MKNNAGCGQMVALQPMAEFDIFLNPRLREEGTAGTRSFPVSQMKSVNIAAPSPSISVPPSLSHRKLGNWLVGGEGARGKRLGLMEATRKSISSTP